MIVTLFFLHAAPLAGFDPLDRLQENNPLRPNLRGAAIAHKWRHRVSQTTNSFPAH
jgi:hypothetical protein